MAIAPVDLQVLFTQMEKVGKAQAAQREGQVLQQSLQGVQIQKKIEEEINQVNEAQNTGEGAEKVKDKDQEAEGQKNKKNFKKDNDEEETEEEQSPSVLTDPSLGRKIDISF
jgi:ribosomal protein L12E/L44/L45/RPP1/RPP2